MNEKKEAHEIVERLRNPDILRRVIDMMKTSDPIGITIIKKGLKEDKMKCKHKEGWVLKEKDTIVINPDWENDGLIAEFECNVIGCNVIKKFKFDITNIEEIKEKK